MRARTTSIALASACLTALATPSQAIRTRRWPGPGRAVPPVPPTSERHRESRGRDPRAPPPARRRSRTAGCEAVGQSSRSSATGLAESRAVGQGLLQALRVAVELRGLQLHRQREQPLLARRRAGCARSGGARSRWASAIGARDAAISSTRWAAARHGAGCCRARRRRERATGDDRRRVAALGVEPDPGDDPSAAGRRRRARPGPRRGVGAHPAVRRPGRSTVRPGSRQRVAQHAPRDRRPARRSARRRRSPRRASYARRLKRRSTRSWRRPRSGRARPLRPPRRQSRRRRRGVPALRTARLPNHTTTA